MAMAWAVQRLTTYRGRRCEHHLLRQVTRPAYPNADGGAEDAAYAFQESALAHLGGWFEERVLPRVCPRSHEAETSADVETDEPLAGPGLRWLDHDGRRVFLLTDAGAGGDLFGSLDG